MSGSNRVAWREGQFLRPQHFQQADRAIEARLRARVDALRPYAWGLNEIKLDEDLAGLGKFSVARARGVMPDGTPFSIPEDLPPPPPLDVPLDTRDATIFITLPAAHSGSREYAEAEGAGAETAQVFPASRLIWMSPNRP